jgi:putative DNA primase/helicase
MSTQNGNGDIHREIALKALDSGLSPGLPTEDGLKKPDGQWKRYQKTPATREEVIAWYRRGRTGNAIFTGYGNVEALEWDAKGEMFAPFLEAAAALGIGDLVERIRDGYEEESPSGGIHLLYRCETISGNTKLAERPAPTEKDPNARQTLIETRGVGGFLVIAPSNGKVHPSGRAYKLRRGSLDSIVTITPDEREALWSLARSFDEIPEDPATQAGLNPQTARPSATSHGQGVSPGDDFEARARLADIIEPFGWKRVHVSGGVEYWRRPGKDEGWSATWGKTKGFRVFTSSTSLEAKSHTLFYVYCRLRHHGDWKSCVKDLVQQGYGTWVDDQGQEHQNPPPKRAKQSQQSPPPAPPNGDGHQQGEAEPPINPTDTGNARRLAKLFGDRIRYCHAWRAWFVWDGKRWRRDDTGEIFRLAKKTVQAIGTEASQIEDDAKWKALLKWALQSEGKKQIEYMVFLAQSEPGIAVRTDAWDADDWALNVQNGTVDLKTGKLRPHRKEDLITRLAPIEFDPDAKAPRWEQFEREIFAEDASIAHYMRRAIGAALTGDDSIQELVIAFGDGSNGKNKYFDTIHRMLGDYAAQAEPNLLLQAGQERHPTGVADLFGKRYVVTSETDDGKELAEALFKRLTGDGIIKARRMREDFFEFKRTFKVFLATNHKPEVKGRDYATWRRIRLVPFNVTFVKEGQPTSPPNVLQEDPALGAALFKEAPGILTLMVEACLEWQRNGIKPPAAVISATDEYKAETDHLAEFISDECKSYLDHDVLKTQAKTEANSIFARYLKWAHDSNYKPIAKRVFGSRLEKLGYTLHKGSSKCWRLGIKLKDRTVKTPGDPRPGASGQGSNPHNGPTY